MLQLGEQTSHGGQVFFVIWGVGALVMGSVFASKKGSGWARGVIVSGLQERPVPQARARRFGGVRVIGGVLAVAGLIGIVSGIVMLSRG